MYDVNIEDETENSLRVSFFTAWSPPLRGYAQLQKLGFTIDAKFMEIGYDFCGYWKEGIETIFENVHENIDNVPEEFHYYFCDEEDDD